jgi:hypothetical protein
MGVLTEALAVRPFGSAAPDIVYARGVLADPSSDAFNKKDCSLILFEVGFCRDLGCHEKYT